MVDSSDMCAGGGITDSWKSCAICLEEMADSDLMVHTACGGTLCQSCLEVGTVATNLHECLEHLCE